MRWKKLGKLEYALGPMVGQGCAIVNQNCKYLNEYIIFFGGWDGRGYTNKTTIFDTSRLMGVMTHL